MPARQLTAAMGFLEDLKQEAQTVKAERQQQETTEQALQASIAQLQPRLARWSEARASGPRASTTHR